MIRDGAKIIDIGGESTRPGHAPVSFEEELERTVPIIEALTNELGCAVSIDTYKAGVAEAAIKAGAHIINDVWGAKREPEIANVAARTVCQLFSCIIVKKAEYEGRFMDEVLADLKESVEIAQTQALHGKYLARSWYWLCKRYKAKHLGDARTAENTEMGYPVLLGTSRKSLIGNVLGLPVEERLEGTGATVCYGIEKGCHIIRVHDVKEIARMTKDDGCING